MTQIIRSSESHRRSLAYIAGEIAITTAGILIALAANSWWQNHQDRKSEKQLLTEMRSELVADTADLHSDEMAYGVVLGATKDLPTRLRDGRPTRRTSTASSVCR